MSALVIACPDCDARMVERVNHQNDTAFMGCSRWPECTATRPVPTYIAMQRQGATPLPGWENL